MPSPNVYTIPVRIIIFSAILILVGTSYCLYLGRIGYMPQDSPAVFDGGWRILSGQMPFRDFTAPNAIVPILLQSVFFSVFGVNWFAYCLHASIFNGLFCVLVFLFLIMSGGTLSLSFFYALLSGVVFYTPFGIPLQDQHAFFFTLLFIFAACLVVWTHKRSMKNMILFCLPTLMTIAYFSKQIPTLFGVLIALGIIFVFERNSLLTTIQFLFMGAVFIALLLWLGWITVGVDLNLVMTYFLRIPAELGFTRFSMAYTSRFFTIMRHMLKYWNLFFPFILVVLYAMGALILILKQKKEPAAGVGLPHKCFPLLLSLFLVILTFVFLVLTNNQSENGASLIFLAIGLLHIFLLQNPKQRGLLLAGIILWGGSLLCAWNFHSHVNMTRIVHDLDYEKSVTKDYTYVMPEGLSFLVWSTPECYKGTPQDFVKTINFFKINHGNFFLLGDSSILYALTGKVSVNPVLWFDPGQTLPSPSSPMFPDFQDLLMKTLKNHHVKFIILETTRITDGRGFTWSKVNLTYFPKLDKLVQETGRVRAVFGVFTIIELADNGKPSNTPYEKISQTFSSRLFEPASRQVFLCMPICGKPL